MLAVAASAGVGVGAVVLVGAVVGVETAAVSGGRASVGVAVATWDVGDTVPDGGTVAVTVAGATPVAVDVGEPVGLGLGDPPPSPPHAATSTVAMTQKNHFTTNHLHETGQAKGRGMPRPSLLTQGEN
jgi:hypothetical protein